MQDHHYSFEVEGQPEELWQLFWNKRKGQVLEHGDVRIEILHAGDETGEGPPPIRAISTWPGAMRKRWRICSMG